MCSAPFTTAAAIAIYAACNISSDVLVLAVPLVVLRSITKRPRERYGVFFLVFLGAGTIATTAACCALHIAYRRDLVVNYAVVQLAELLALIELAVALAAVSLPSLKAVLYRRDERRRSRTSSAARWSKPAPDSAASADDDEQRLVIMRRLSYGVESVELPERAHVSA